jgi:hypothetical protein
MVQYSNRDLLKSDFGDFHQPESHRPLRRRKAGKCRVAEVLLTNTATCKEQGEANLAVKQHKKFKRELRR